MPSGKSRKTGTSSRKTKIAKQAARSKFRARHIDQVWEDVRKAEGVHDGKVGPLGTSDKVELDEDLPAHGQHFCIACSRYFISTAALEDHQKTKPHRRRVKELMGARPHNQGDAEWAAGMGAPDNGQRLGGGGGGGEAPPCATTMSSPMTLESLVDMFPAFGITFIRDVGAQFDNNPELTLEALLGLQTEGASGGAPPVSPPPKALHTREAMQSVLFPGERRTKFSGTTEPPCRPQPHHPPFTLEAPPLLPNSATAGQPTEAPSATEPQNSVSLDYIIPGLATLDTGQHPPAAGSPASKVPPPPRARRPAVGASRGWWPYWPLAPATLGGGSQPQLGRAVACAMAAASPPPRCTHTVAGASGWLPTPPRPAPGPGSVPADQWSAGDNLLDESKYRTPPRIMSAPAAAAASTGGPATDGALAGTPPATPCPLLDGSAHQANGAHDAAPGSPSSEDELLAALMPHLAHCLGTPTASGASTPGGGGEPHAPPLRGAAPSPLSLPALPAGGAAPLRSASRLSQRAEGGYDAAELVAAVEFHLQMFPNLKREVVGDVLQRHSDAPQAGLDTLIMLSACVEDAAGEAGSGGAEVPDAAGWESGSGGSGSDDEGAAAAGGAPGRSWEGGLTAGELAGFEEGMFPDARLVPGAPTAAAAAPEAANVLPAEEKRQLLKAEFGSIAAAEVEAALAACDGSLFAAAELLRLFVEEDAAQKQQQGGLGSGGAHGAAAAAASVPAADAHGATESSTSCLPQHARPKVQHLARRFPDASPESLEVALASAGFDLPTARCTLREAGYTEVAVEPPPAPRQLQPAPASLALPVPLPVPLPPRHAATGGSGGAGRGSAASSPPAAAHLGVPSASPSAPSARLSLSEATYVRNQAIWEQERAQAQRLEQAYRRCFALAADAHNRGDHQAAAEYSMKGREYRQQYFEEQGKASRRISKRVNAANGMPRISVDLHGQTVESALATVESGIRSLPESIPGGVVVRYITGRGRHSAGGAARIRPEVLRLLGEHGIPCVEGPGGGWVEATLVPPPDEH